MLPIMATRYNPVGLGYVPWPLGQEAQTGAGGGGAGLTTADVPPLITAGGGFLTNLISAIRGVPTGYPPGAYPGAPGYVEPFPWGTVVIFGGLAVGGYFLVKALAKRKNPRRRRRKYRVYRRRR